MSKKEFWNIPNMITSYRLVMFPVIMYFALSGKQNLFAVFILINLFTDFIDGIIARRLNMVTEIGAKLDSFADNFTYLLAVIGMLIFKMEDLRPHLVSFIGFVSINVLTVVISLIKFRKFPSFHGYMTKIGGYIEGAFFISLFTLGFFLPLYYLMIVWGILGAIEHISIQLIIPEMRSNVKGIYWVLKERNAQNEEE